jgi:hypothetical protein
MLVIARRLFPRAQDKEALVAECSVRLLYLSTAGFTPIASRFFNTLMSTGLTTW